MAPKLTTEADVRIGARVRAAREAARLSQGDLAQHLGITWQQVAKYENASNRISASRLQDIANRLGVTVFAFYDPPDMCFVPQPLTVRQAEDALRIAAKDYADAVLRSKQPVALAEAA